MYFIPNRFECFCVLDLNKLTTSQLSRRALAIIKEQAAIDSVCFPETMSKMLIVNAPTYFSATWRIIKGWLDARTAAKIEVISSRTAMEKRLLEFIDADQLPIDYGGTGPDTNVSMNEGIAGDFSRLETHMLYIRYVLFVHYCLIICSLCYIWAIKNLTVSVGIFLIKQWSWIGNGRVERERGGPSVRFYSIVGGR
jgi:hypothetical protein